MRTLCVIACVATAGFLAVAGCSKKEEAKASTVDIEARLAKADALDGKVDKVVAKCGNCALGMEGKSMYSLKTHGFEMQFCAEGCQREFQKDPDKAILAMKIPGE
jgi:hypothetical protein